uniref:C3H1-type domain-containing protein n=1 Tax=Timema douglasi TaxID=61478 RepID=A0A7R8VD15_TIMDO|nr:unnamed protein product [Timema douglasi]
MAQNTLCGAPATAIETTSQEQTQNNSHHIIYNRTIHVNPKLSALYKNKEFIQKLLAENKTQPVRPHSIYFNPKFLVNKPKEKDSNNARLLLQQHNQGLDPSSRRETNANPPFVMKQLSRNALNELKFSNGSSCDNNQSKGPHSAVIVPINFYEKPKYSLETNITNLEESDLPKQSYKISSSKESKPNDESNCHSRFALDESKSLEQLYDIAKSSLGRSKKNPYLNYDANHPSHKINSPTHLRPVLKSSSEGLRLLNSTQDIFQIEKPKRKSHNAHSNSNLKSHSITGLKRKILENVPETSMSKKGTPTSNKITSLEAPRQVGLLNMSMKQVNAISGEHKLMDEGKTTNLDCSSFVINKNVQRPDECLSSLKESNDTVLENPSLLHGGTPEQNSSDNSVFKVPVDIPPRKKSAEKTAEERYIKRVEYLKLRKAKSSSRTTSTASFAPRLIGSGKASKLKHLGLIIQKKKMCNDFSDDDNNTAGEGRSYLTDLACDCMSSEALAKTPRSRYKRRVKAANCIYDCDTKDSQVPMPNWDQNVHDVNSRVSEWLSSSPDVSSFEVNVNTTCSKVKLSSKSKSNKDKINHAQSGKPTEDVGGSSSRDSSRTRQKREESKRVNQPNFSYNGSDSHNDIVMQLQNIGLERDVNLLSNEIATQIRNISMERNDTNCCEVGMEDFDISDVYPMFHNMPTEDGEELDESLGLKDKPPCQNLEQKIHRMTSNDDGDEVYKNGVDVNKQFSPNQDELIERKDNFSCQIYESKSADMEIDDETKVGSSSDVEKPDSPVISNDTKEEIPQTHNVHSMSDIATGIEYGPSLVQSSHVDLPKNLNSEESYFVKSKTKLIRQSSTSKSSGYSGAVKRNSPSNLKIKRSGSLVSVSKTKLVRKNSSSVGKTSSPPTFTNKRRLPTRGGKKLVRMPSQTCNSSFMSVSTTKLVRIRKPSLTSVRSRQTPKARRRTSVSSLSSSVKATKSTKTKYSLSRCSPNHPSCRKSPHHTLRRVCLKSKYRIDRRAQKASRLVVKKVKKYSLKYEGVRKGDSVGARKAKTKVQYSGKDASYHFVKQLGSINRVWRNAADCFNPQKIVVTNKKLQRIGRSPTNDASQNLKRKSNLVQIGGMLYKCTRNKLTRTPASKISETADAGAVEKRGHVLYVRGDKFIMDFAGKTMRRITEDGGSRENMPVKRGARTRIDIGGVTFLQKSPNVLIRTETHKARSILSQAKQKSIAILTQKMRKSNELCMFYQRFGKCSKKEKGLCPKVHDPKRIAVCRKFLLGKCELVACPLSHEVVPEKMPTCRYFLEAVCVRDNCPYLHVKHNPKTDICLGFLQGYCSQGEKCQKRHENMCPEFDKYGKCSRGKFCSYPHKLNTKQPSKGPARSSKTPIRKTRRAAEPKPERRRYYQDNDKKQESQTALHDDSHATGKETECQVDQRLSLVGRHDHFDITDYSSYPTSAPCEESKVMRLKCHPMPDYISLK